MKKLYLITLIGMILLVGVFVNSAISTRDMNLDDNVKTFLNSLNNDSVEVGDIICDDTTCSQRMWKGDYNLGEVTIDYLNCSEYQSEELDGEIIEGYCVNYTPLSEKDIKKAIQKAQEQKLKDIENVAKLRKERALQNKTIVDGVTISY